MSVLWIIVLCVVALAALATLVDLFRGQRSAREKAGWTLLIVLLPFVGSIFYWARRKPTRAEVDQQQLAAMDLKRSAARRPFDSTGTGP